MPEIGERGEEKREKTREEERGERNCTARSPWHMPGRNEMQKEPGGARAPEFSSMSVVCPLQTWCGCGVGRQQHPLADATPPTRPATTTAHDALARESVRAKRLGGRRTRQLRSQSSCWRWSICPGEMEMGLSEGKKTQVRGQDATLKMSECHWVRGPGPRLGG